VRKRVPALLALAVALQLPSVAVGQAPLRDSVSAFGQDSRCKVHRISQPLGVSATGRHRVAVRARTTRRRWSRQAVRTFDPG
jgi:hypothetical protein